MFSLYPTPLTLGFLNNLEVLELVLSIHDVYSYIFLVHFYSLGPLD